MLDGRLGIPAPLQDDALGLIVVEVDVVLQRAGVLIPHDLHGLSGQALELLELALVKLEPSDTQKLTHGSAPQTSRLLIPRTATPDSISVRKRRRAFLAASQTARTVGRRSRDGNVHLIPAGPSLPTLGDPLPVFVVGARHLVAVLGCHDDVDGPMAT
jgi:hypothetical protein